MSEAGTGDRGRSEFLRRLEESGAMTKSGEVKEDEPISTFLRAARQSSSDLTAVYDSKKWFAVVP